MRRSTRRRCKIYFARTVRCSVSRQKVTSGLEFKIHLQRGSLGYLTGAATARSFRGWPISRICDLCFRRHGRHPRRPCDCNGPNQPRFCYVLLLFAISGGLRTRAVGRTRCNNYSSRSHVVFVLHAWLPACRCGRLSVVLSAEPRWSSSPCRARSGWVSSALSGYEMIRDDLRVHRRVLLASAVLRLTLVDLAGSEKVSKNECVGETFEEVAASTELEVAVWSPGSQSSKC